MNLQTQAQVTISGTRKELIALLLHAATDAMCCATETTNPDVRNQYGDEHLKYKRMHDALVHGNETEEVIC